MPSDTTFYFMVPCLISQHMLSLSVEDNDSFTKSVIHWDHSYSWKS